MIRRASLWWATLSLLAPLGAGGAAPAKKTTAARAASAKKSTARKAARRTVRPPAVSAAQRASAAQAVARWLDVPNSIENAAALVPFLEQLYRVEKGLDTEPLRILHYGDSHTASDDWAGTLRYLFQTKFGDGGPGFSHAGRPWNSYRRYDVSSWGSRFWHTDGLFSREGDGWYGLSAASITATRAGEWVTLDATCAQAELLYLERPGGGSFQVSVDHGEPLRVDTNGPLRAAYLKIPIAPGAHRFEVRTLDARPVRLFGWVTENPRGITYETLGINGAQANMLLNVDESLFVEHLSRRNPALIILAYGTNEAGARDWTLESYRAMFAQLLERLRRAAPAASILVVGPPDRYIRTRAGWVPLDRVDMIVQAQREAATQARCAFFDLRERMGGKASMRQWVQSGMAQYDHVHFTAQGYRLLGAALYKELTGQFSLYSKIRSDLDLNPKGTPSPTDEQARSNSDPDP
jgi:lysophospholipase L1-like esterase